MGPELEGSEGAEREEVLQEKVTGPVLGFVGRGL